MWERDKEHIQQAPQLKNIESASWINISCNNLHVAEVQIRRGILLVFPQYLLSSNQSYDMGIQRNPFIETILLSTHNIALDGQIMIWEHAKWPLSRALMYFAIDVK